MDKLLDIKLITAQELKAITDKIDEISANLKSVCKRADNPLQDRWLDNEEAMQLLKVSPRTLQNYRDKGVLPYSMISGKVYYKAKDIEDALRENYLKR